MWTERVAKIVKGVFLALALVVALERTPAPEETLLALVGAVIAVIAGDLYGLTLQTEIERERRVTWAETRGMLGGLAFVGVGALPSIVLFALAWLDVVDDDTALELAVWTGVVILGALGLVAARLTSRTALGASFYALTLLAAGAVVVLFKTLH